MMEILFALFGFITCYVTVVMVKNIQIKELRSSLKRSEDILHCINEVADRIKGYIDSINIINLKYITDGAEDVTKKKTIKKKRKATARKRK